MNIAVFLGANCGTNKHIEEETKKLGTFIGKHNHTLVYGGSKTGLMLELASSTKENKGHVIGIEAKMFYEDGKAYDLCDEFFVTDTLSERKMKMMNISDAFIALPGGTGTLDEITEIMVLDKLDKVHRPIYFINIDNFYDDMIKQLDKMVDFGFLTKHNRDLVKFIKSVDELETSL